MEGELISSDDAAEAIGMNSTGYLYAWLQRHPEFKPKAIFGRSYIWTQEEIDAVIEERTKPEGEDNNG